MYNRYQMKADFFKITILFAALFAALFFVSCGGAEGTGYDAGGDVDAYTYSGAEQAAAAPAPQVNEALPAFHINDPGIKMIEVRQSFDTGTDHFAAGIETAVAVTFYEPVSEIFSEGIPLCCIAVYRDEAFLTLLQTPGDPGGNTLFFRPKSISEAGGWAEESYTFILYFEEGEGVPAAILKAVFYKSGEDDTYEDNRDPPELPEGIADPESAAPFILSEQDEIQEVILGEEIRLEALIYDAGDGWLEGEEVIWTLNGKEYMTGNILWIWPYELPPGTYTFLCTAANSSGVSSQKDFTFIITADDDFLPDDWFRDELESALSKGLILPLDRLGMPVSESGYNALMAKLYNAFSHTGDTWPDSSIGLMNSLTEEEAAKIMCRTILKAIPDFMGAGRDEALVMEALYSLGIYNEYGPDAFRPSEKLTNRLALIRVGRLFDAVFSNELRIIADSYELYQCDIAAGAMNTAMRKAGKHGAVVNLYFYDGSSVHAEGYGVDKHIVSRTGIHVGVLYNGRIHCNVFPAGLPEKEWLSCFHVDSGKRPRIEYLPV